MTDLMAAPPALGEASSTEVPWADTELTLVCRRVVQVTHDVRTFVLEPWGPGPAPHRPGQYLTLTVTVEGEDIQRCYTISSPPTRPGTLTVTVKRVPGGPVSNWLHDNLVVGSVLGAAGPFGRFTLVDHPAPKYLFLSAGSGITPLMSMTRTLCDNNASRDVAFVHSARSPQDIIFRRELEAMAAALPGIGVTTICEQGSSLEQWHGPLGRLSLPLLRNITPDLLEREIFTCGPQPYMESVRLMLAEAGADPARCHEETFCFEKLKHFAVSPADADARGPGATGPSPGAQVFTVELRRSGRRIECDAHTTVLTAALRAGVDIPSSCAEGACGTCKSSLLCGSVDMHHAGGIRPREIAQNKFLPCCSTPLENLVIDR